MSEGAPPARGNLRVYLGAAPGVGKTYAMLSEAHRRVDRGTDVVIGYVETHGRRYTAELAEGLETIPRQTLTYRGAPFEEMDVDAILRRHPRVAIVDELAHTNVAGSRNEKRWQDVELLLEAGIDVVTAVNIQHLESVNDVVEKITGIRQLETVPDAVVRAADQIELRDMTAEALRRRLAHGNVYAPEKVDAALSNYFRVGNLNALREIALLWTADRVEDALDHYRAQHAITGTWETRERVVVALTGGPEGHHLIRRAARIASRMAPDSETVDLLAVHVVRADGLAARESDLVAQRQLVESLGGSYHQVLGDDVAAALLAFARAENATQLVLGESSRRGLRLLLSSFGATRAIISQSGDIDVHIVTHESSGSEPTNQPGHRFARPSRRHLAGFALGLALPAALTAFLTPFTDSVNLVSDMLLFLLATVLCAMIGGFAVAVVAAVASSLLLNYYFTPPLHTFDIQESNNAFALLVFIAVGLQVSWAMTVVTRRTREAARAAAEARTLADLASASLIGEDRVAEMLGRVRETFALSSVALYSRSTTTGAWAPIAVAGDGSTTQFETADVKVPVSRDLTLGLHGRILEASDRRLVTAFAAQVAVAYDHQLLSQEAASAAPLAEANKVRTALLAAVGHDLRTPLAAAKASVSGLRSRDIRLDAADRDELLKAADESLDKLSALVDNLLDMSRLQAGAMPVVLVATSIDEVVARALDEIGPQARRVLIDIPEDLPTVTADGGLLERVLANLVANALRHSPADRPPALTASSVAERVEIRVIDRGPGISATDLDRVFLPFQRLGDTDNAAGVGLGLALSRGLTEAMGGTLEPEETPGGGLTMVVALSAHPEVESR